MLILIGLGLYDEKDLTFRGLELAKRADELYIEFYTSKWHGKVENLEKLVGKKILKLERRDLEELAMKIVKKAKEKDVAIFVQGDPLVQTTHASLLLEAKKEKVRTRVVHNASIVTAIAETGLHSQKFGRYVTIPFLDKTKGELPKSVYDVIEKNKKEGLHTLCLLDVVNERYMTPNEGMKILLLLEEVKKGQIFTEETKIIVLCRVGSPSSKIYFGKVKDLTKNDYGDPPAVIIVPGKLHFTEEQALKLSFPPYQ